RGVVISNSRDFCVRYRFKVERADQLIHSGNTAMIPKGILLRAKVRRAGQKSREPAERATASGAAAPSIFESSHIRVVQVYTSPAICGQAKGISDVRCRISARAARHRNPKSDIRNPLLPPPPGYNTPDM